MEPRHTRVSDPARPPPPGRPPGLRVATGPAAPFDAGAAGAGRLAAGAGRERAGSRRQSASESASSRPAAPSRPAVRRHPPPARPAGRAQAPEAVRGRTTTAKRLDCTRCAARSAVCRPGQAGPCPDSKQGPARPGPTRTGPLGRADAASSSWAGPFKLGRPPGPPGLRVATVHAGQTPRPGGPLRRGGGGSGPARGVRRRPSRLQVDRRPRAGRRSAAIRRQPARLGGPRPRKQSGAERRLRSDSTARAARPALRSADRVRPGPAPTPSRARPGPVRLGRARWAGPTPLLQVGPARSSWAGPRPPAARRWPAVIRPSRCRDACARSARARALRAHAHSRACGCHVGCARASPGYSRTP